MLWFRKHSSLGFVENTCLFKLLTVISFTTIDKFVEITNDLSQTARHKLIAKKNTEHKHQLTSESFETKTHFIAMSTLAALLVIT